MKDYLKDPRFYLIAVPALAGLWALYAWLFALPSARDKVASTQEVYEKVNEQIARILELAGSQRLEYGTGEDGAAEFDYATLVQEYAAQWRIPSSDYSLQVNPEVRRKGKLTQGANITINDVSIETFSQFISTMLIRWPGLQCDQIKLSRTKAGPDTWRIAMKMTYVY